MLSSDCCSNPPPGLSLPKDGWSSPTMSPKMRDEVFNQKRVGPVFQVAKVSTHHWPRRRGPVRSLTFICDPSALEYPFFAATGGVNGHHLPLGIHSIIPQSGCHFIYIFKISRKICQVRVWTRWYGDWCFEIFNTRRDCSASFCISKTRGGGWNFSYLQPLLVLLRIWSLRPTKL